MEFEEPIESVHNVGNTLITSMPSGEVEVDFSPEENKVIPSQDTKHFENLVDKIDENILNTLASSLVDAIEDDISSRQEWETNLTKGIDLLGFKVEADRTFPFEGASGVYSSAYLESFLTISDICVNEILPAEGPVDIEILGEETPELEDRAERVKLYMNYYLTHDYKSFYNETDICMRWAIIAGSCFKKTYIDPLQNKIKSKYIMPQDFIVNSNAVSIEEASRITHKFKLTSKQLKLMQLNGVYKNTKLYPLDEDNHDSLVDTEIREIEGINNQDFDRSEDKLYELYECHCDVDLKGFEHQDGSEKTGLPLPYVVILDPESQKILSITRNWKEDDKNYTRINIFTQYLFMPGFWLYGYGLAHLAAGTAEGATIMTRQLIDNGFLANFPGGLRVKPIRN